MSKKPFSFPGRGLPAFPLRRKELLHLFQPHVVDPDLARSTGHVEPDPGPVLGTRVRHGGELPFDADPVGASGHGVFGKPDGLIAFAAASHSDEGVEPGGFLARGLDVFQPHEIGETVLRVGLESVKVLAGPVVGAVPLEEQRGSGGPDRSPAG